MTNERKFIDIDDFGNIENAIKKIDPAFVDITKRLPAQVSNFAQQKMSMAIKPQEAEELGLVKPYHLYLLGRKK